MKAVELKDVSYNYPDGTIALKQLSLSLTGKKIVLLGANGSGKSTLLQQINGLMKPTSGDVFVQGMHVTKKNLPTIRKQVGIVFDYPENQLVATSVYEDIAFGPRNLGYEEEKVQKSVEKAMELVSIEHLAERIPFHLSLGQKKKVAIAGVLAMEPEIILFDEPFSGLDPESLQQFLTTLNRLETQGKTLIISTHDVDIAYEWADECVILHDGQVLAQGDISVLESRKLLEKAKLRLPILATIFAEMDILPRTAEEARDLLKRIRG